MIILLRMGICQSAARRHTARSTGRADRTLLRSAAHPKKWRAAVNHHTELLCWTGPRPTVLEAAMATAAREDLPNDGRRREGRFIAAQAGPIPPIAKLNDAMRVLNRTLTSAAKEVVRSA